MINLSLILEKSIPLITGIAASAVTWYGLNRQDKRDTYKILVEEIANLRNDRDDIFFQLMELQQQIQVLRQIETTCQTDLRIALKKIDELEKRQVPKEIG
jgi:uncharacterized coiled-coil DUF342 family protein